MPGKRFSYGFDDQESVIMPGKGFSYGFDCAVKLQLCLERQEVHSVKAPRVQRLVVS